VHCVNEAIRDRLKVTGKLGPGKMLTAYQTVDGTDAQKREARFYAAGQHALFLKRYGRFAKGEFCAIEGANERGVVLVKDGRRSTLSYRYTDRITVTAPSNIEVARGDRLQLKFNGKSAEGEPFNNGELVTVWGVRKNGALVVVDEAGKRKTLASSQRLFNRGYAVTSYAAQGKTVDTVLLADAANPGATNRNQWYVAISRGRKRAVVFTSDKDELRANVQRTGDRRLAMDLKANASAPAAPTRQQVQRLPTWTRRAWATIQRLQRQQFVENCNSRMQPALSVRQRSTENHQSQVQSAPKMRIKL
jgi:hypothetical protein